MAGAITMESTLTTRPTVALDGALSSAIRSLHATVEQHRDSAVTHASAAAKAAIQCGGLLADAAQAHKGTDVVGWAVSAAGIDRERALAYVRVHRKHRENFDAGQIEFSMVRELMIATQVLPEPPRADHTNDPSVFEWWKATKRLRTGINALSDFDRQRLRGELLAIIDLIGCGK
jgi:hypothetical protein